MELRLAQTRGQVRDRMRQTGLADRLGTEHVSSTVELGVRAFSAQELRG